jgi:hypothetical protein
MWRRSGLEVLFGRFGLAAAPVLANYTFLTRCREMRKTNVYAGPKCPFLGGFSNNREIRPFLRVASHVPTRAWGVLLLEELFIHLFDIQGFLDPATNVVANHQAREQIAIDKYDSLA